MKISHVFVISLVLACSVQLISLFEIGPVDAVFWTKQASDVATGNPDQYNPTFAYGHPGGPVIEGTIATYIITGLPYNKSLLTFLGLFYGLLIALIASLCFALKKHALWWIPVLGVLSFDRLYLDATPPSALVSLILLLLFLLTLWIYEKKQIGWKSLTVWSLLAGMAVATRADIGSLTTVFLSTLLLSKIPWKLWLKVMVGTFASFIIFDPYMWYMPIQHMSDLMSKMLFHYDEFVPMPLRFGVIANISSLSFMSIVFAFIFIWNKKKWNVELLPNRFVYTMLAETVLLYTIFLTSRYQAVRYYMPILFIWQALLPMYILSIIPKLRFSFLKTEKAQKRGALIFSIFIIAILVASQAYFLWDNLFFAY